MVISVHVESEEVPSARDSASCCHVLSGGRLGSLHSTFSISLKCQLLLGRAGTTRCCQSGHLELKHTTALRTS